LIYDTTGSNEITFSTVSVPGETAGSPSITVIVAEPSDYVTVMFNNKTEKQRKIKAMNERMQKWVK
jgi:hypothetical protein